MIVLPFIYLSILSLTAATSSSPRALFGSNDSLRIRQQSCPDGSTARIGYHCCSDGASCANGLDCVPNGCCPTGKTCSGGGGTLTFPGTIDTSTLDFSTPAATSLERTTSAADAPVSPTPTNLDAYESSLLSAASNTDALPSLSSFDGAALLSSIQATAPASLQSALDAAQSYLSELETGSGTFVPAVAPAPTGTGAAISTEESSSTRETSARRSSTMSTTLPTASSGSGGIPASSAENQPESGVDGRAVGSVTLVGAACVALLVLMGAL